MKTNQSFFQKSFAKIGAAALLLVIIIALAWRPLQVLNLQARAGTRIESYIEAIGEPASRFLACQMPLLMDLPEDQGLSEAVALLEQAREYKPFQGQSLYQLGRAYCLEGKYGQAIDALYAFIGTHPENPKGALEAAYAHLNLGEEAQAVQRLSEAGYGFAYFLTQGQRAFEDRAYPTAWLSYRTAALFEPLPEDAALQLELLSDSLEPQQ